jgi:hypothetical protein
MGAFTDNKELNARLPYMFGPRDQDQCLRGLCLRAREAEIGRRADQPLQRSNLMWKAVLVLFMTSNTQPISMMVGQFPQTFMKKSQCQEFVAKASNDISGTVEVITKNTKLGVHVFHHEISCLEDTGGQPV